jgi:ribonuclease HI
MRGWITINTDAGWYPIEKIGAYAYWIKGDDLFLRGSGAFKKPCKNPTEAEMKAILNALHVLDKSGYNQFKKIIFNRDNIHAISSRKQGGLKREIWIALRKLADKSCYVTLNPFWEFRHVKSKVNDGSARSFVNQWCHDRCTEELRIAKRNLLKNG